MSKIDYEPIGTAITVLAPELSEKTSGGIYKPAEILEEERRNFTGAVTVKHVGPNASPQIKPGYRILLRNNANMEHVNIKGLDLWQVDSFAVLGVIRKS